MARASDALHMAIFCVDVEGFTAAGRSDRDRREARAGLYEALERAFKQAEVPWKRCHHEDRGDGVLILVPSEVPKNRLVADLAPCTRLTGVSGVAVSFGWPAWVGAAPAPLGAASTASASATTATTANLARRWGVPPRRMDSWADPGVPIATSGVGRHPRRRGTGC